MTFNNKQEKTSTAEKLVKNSAWLFLSEVLSKVTTLGIQIIAARYLGENGFGISKMDPKFDTRIWEPAPKFGTQGKIFRGGMVFQEGGMGEPKWEMKPMGVTNPLAKPNR